MSPRALTCAAMLLALFGWSRPSQALEGELPVEAAAYLEEHLPVPGLLLYGPPEDPGVGSPAFREAWKEGSSLVLADVPSPSAAAVEFGEAAEVATADGDHSARAVALFAQATCEAQAGAGNHRTAVGRFRTAISAIADAQTVGGSQRLMSYEPAPIGSSPVWSTHVYHNLIATYLSSMDETGAVIGDPWARREFRDPSGGGPDNPHSEPRDLHSQQGRGSVPVYLAYANSNLERLFRDLTNVRMALLVAYSSAATLAGLGIRQPSSPTYLDRMLLATPTPQPEPLPLWEVGTFEKRVWTGQGASGLLARAAFRRALERGDVTTAERLLAAWEKELPEESETAFLAATAPSRLEDFLGLSNPTPADAREIRELAARVRDREGLEHLEDLTVQAEKLADLVDPGGPGVGERLRTWLVPVLLTTLLLGPLFLLLLYWKTLMANLRYWAQLDDPGYEEDPRAARPELESLAPQPKPASDAGSRQGKGPPKRRPTS